MPDANTRTATVVVEVDADIAFRIHRRDGELVDPRTHRFYDSTRAVGIRCESGVGGRRIEVYDASTGEGLELGRIQAWSRVVV